MSEILNIRSKFRDYHVTFIDEFQETIKRHGKEDSYIIIDKKLTDLFGEQLDDILSECFFIGVEATEFNKTFDYCQSLIENLIEKDIRKNCVLIAIGGGVIQDITAFISSIIFRGIRWVFYPTTLLAQADSCIGSKNSINLGGYKNLLGNFYPPSDIYIDMEFLETLPIGEIKSGIGEILHFYLIAGSELLKELVNDYDELIISPKKLKKYILESLKIKKSIIEIDEFDTNERNLFNYGHTFGHAIETVSRYTINHGQAVTMGMDIANYISLRLGHLNKESFDFMHAILAKNMPSFRLRDDTIGKYLVALSRDKKNIGNQLGCILSSGPGAMKKILLPFDDHLKSMVRAYFSAE